ncbi:hypothetical protein L873DRAFT_1799249 [Choiromyces venosus 120613-1]|uniref:Uncharacterized protein n=1 Tax=Choiromyces venosus 120613-1 TaxID=1336337 RepID=A0A3N4K4X4_9PEZI|nr:hypothetical protein L873DRAFT_1799249 [Choiromyces venosus 120613-1]
MYHRKSSQSQPLTLPPTFNQPKFSTPHQFSFSAKLTLVPAYRPVSHPSPVTLTVRPINTVLEY